MSCSAHAGHPVIAALTFQSVTNKSTPDCAKSRCRSTRYDGPSLCPGIHETGEMQVKGHQCNHRFERAGIVAHTVKESAPEITPEFRPLDRHAPHHTAKYDEVVQTSLE